MGSALRESACELNDKLRFQSGLNPTRPPRNLHSCTATNIFMKNKKSSSKEPHLSKMHEELWCDKKKEKHWTEQEPEGSAAV